MNDLTIDQVKVGDSVNYYEKPHDKTPKLKTTIRALDSDDRGRPFVLLEGVDEWLPLYHIKLSPSLKDMEPQVKDLYYDGSGLPGNIIIEPVKGIDY